LNYKIILNQRHVFTSINKPVESSQIYLNLLQSKIHKSWLINIPSKDLSSIFCFINLMDQEYD